MPRAVPRAVSWSGAVPGSGCPGRGRAGGPRAVSAGDFRHAACRTTERTRTFPRGPSRPYSEGEPYGGAKGWAATFVF